MKGKHLNMSQKNFNHPTLFMKVCDLLKEMYKYCLARISVKRASMFVYKKVFGKLPDLKTPQDFNEKLMWLKINVYKDSELVTKCVDKYGVREYLKQKGCEDILNDIYGAWDSVDEIDWEMLPQQFVIKCNHGCGYNIICRDKKNFDITEAKEKLRKWMKEDFWLRNIEVNYKGIKRKIVCEKYIESLDTELPIDYKIYYFNGIPKIILVCSDRSKKLDLTFFDLDWKQLDIGKDRRKKNISKPSCLEDMVAYGEKLAAGFPFVRIDFYECDEKPIFGEMTFSPAACMANYYNEEGLMVLGKYLELPM